MSGKYRNPNYQRDWGNSLWKCPICQCKIKQKSRWCHQHRHCLVVSLLKYVKELKDLLEKGS